MKSNNNQEVKNMNNNQLAIVCASCNQEIKGVVIEYVNGDCRCFKCAGKFVDHDEQENSQK